MLGGPIPSKDRLDLSATDHLFASFKAAVKATPIMKRSWPYVPDPAWADCCKRIAESLSGERAVLFVGPFQYCGAVRVDLSRALTTAEALLTFDGDTVSLQSEESDAGLYLDRFEEGEQWRVEVAAWGRWVIAFRNAASI
jgi:hypothetical protein